MRFSGKTVIITGAAAGIGAASVARFLREGAHVAACDVNGERLRETARGWQGDFTCHEVDVSQKEQVAAAVEAALAKSGRIDVLINNAGITRDAQLYKMTDEQFDAVIDVNLRGTYYMTKAVLPAMMEQKNGRIIHTSSIAAYTGNFGQANYAASKGAVYSMTRVMARELGKYGINVNAVAPGMILTDMFAAVPEEIRLQKMKDVPLRRLGDPAEVASVHAFLASEDAAFITGQMLVVDGGKS